MSTRTRAIALATACCLLLPLAAFAAGGASSPNVAFENFKTAMKNKDYKSGYAQMTPESRDMMLGGVAVAMSMGIGMDASKAGEAQKLLDKYGVKKFDPTKIQPGQDPKAAVQDTVSDVKDKSACFADLMGWMEANTGGKEREAKMDAYAHAELTDVKTDGDTAMGTVKVNQNGHDNTTQLSFKKIDGSWYIDPAGQVGPSGHGGGAAK